VTDILEAIDNAIGCHQCGGSLDGSVSDLFCGEACQATWHARRVGEEPDPWLRPAAPRPWRTGLPALRAELFDAAVGGNVRVTLFTSESAQQSGSPSYGAGGARLEWNRTPIVATWSPPEDGPDEIYAFSIGDVARAFDVIPEDLLDDGDDRG
jgi:hypothetical protein